MRVMPHSHTLTASQQPAWTIGRLLKTYWFARYECIQRVINLLTYLLTYH